MIDKLIEEYISRLNDEDIIKFASKYGIVLKECEVKLIYKYIKNDWRTLVYGNPVKIFTKLKQTVSPITYSKSIELYNHFKNKYSSYL